MALRASRGIALTTRALAALASLAVLAACGASSSEDGLSNESGAGGGYYGASAGTGAPGGDAERPDPSKPTGSGGGTDGTGGGTPVDACSTLPKETVTLFLSSDDSNSMGSPVQARELIRLGQWPSQARTYEFLNYYDVGYAAPAQGLSIVPEMAPVASGEPGSFDLQIGVRAANAPAKRRPMTLTLVMDTSGSMEGEPIERARAVGRAIAKTAVAGDVVSVTTWNDGSNVALAGHVVKGPNDPALVSVIDGLAAGGGTDLHGGLVAGYELAKKHYGQERINRVVLVSDGGANIGETNGDVIGESSKDADKEGIYLVGVGTGPIDWYNDTLLDAVTDKGRGAYVYVDSEQEAEIMFTTRFDEVMEVAARGVQVELKLPWYFKISKFHGEEFSTNPEEIEPQHLAPGDAMVIGQVISACAASSVNEADPVEITARWETPLSYEKREITTTTTVGALLAAEKPHLAKGAAIIAYAEAIKNRADKTKIDEALALVQKAGGDADPELREIRELLEKLKSM